MAFPVKKSESSYYLTTHICPFSNHPIRTGTCIPPGGVLRPVREEAPQISSPVVGFPEMVACVAWGWFVRKFKGFFTDLFDVRFAFFSRALITASNQNFRSNHTSKQNFPHAVVPTQVREHVVGVGATTATTRARVTTTFL